MTTLTFDMRKIEDVYYGFCKDNKEKELQTDL